MLDIFDYITIFLLSSIGGFISGFLGVGGGVVFMPILDYFLYKIGLRDDLLVKGIIANSLFTIIFSGSIASYKQYKIGNFYLREILFTALPGIITALIVTYFVKSGTWYSKAVFDIIFASTLLLLIIRLTVVKNKSANGEDKLIKPIKFYFTGFVAGIVTAVSGLGGGVIMTPVFTDVLKMNIKKASSISNGVIPLFAIVLGAYNLVGAPPQFHNWQYGYIFFPIVLPMIFATFIFAPIGVSISQKTKPEVIRTVFLSFISIVFIKLLYEILNK
ncbi:MAG: sulfite exporter TauE/SafE family protein [Bacteroidota bacterium]